MDQDALVIDAQALTSSLDKTAIKPKGVLWVNLPERANGRLWVIPDKEIDKREFYTVVASTISDTGLLNLDAGMIELVDIDRARRIGLDSIPTAIGIGRTILNPEYVNGAMLPDGIVIRMNI